MSREIIGMGMQESKDRVRFGSNIRRLKEFSYTRVSDVRVGRINQKPLPESYWHLL